LHRTINGGGLNAGYARNESFDPHARQEFPCKRPSFARSNLGNRVSWRRIKRTEWQAIYLHIVKSDSLMS